MRPYKFVPRIVVIDDHLREAIGRWKALKRREILREEVPDLPGPFKKEHLVFLFRDLDLALERAEEALASILDYYISQEEV